MSGTIKVGDGSTKVSPTEVASGKAVIIDRGVIKQQKVMVKEFTVGGARLSSQMNLEIGQRFVLRMTDVGGKLFSWFSGVDVDPEEDVSFQVQAEVVSVERASLGIDGFDLKIIFSGNYKFISAEQTAV